MGLISQEDSFLVIYPNKIRRSQGKMLNEISDQQRKRLKRKENSWFLFDNKVL